MAKLTGYVQLKKINLFEHGYGIGGYAWIALFRGTSNRIKRADGSTVAPMTKQADLRFDLLNNPMERGVIID